MKFYTLTEAIEITGEGRHLIIYLIRDCQIPVRLVGPSKVLDEAGLQALKSAIAAFRSKTEQVVPA